VEAQAHAQVLMRRELSEVSQDNAIGPEGRTRQRAVVAIQHATVWEAEEVRDSIWPSTEVALNDGRPSVTARYRRKSAGRPSVTGLGWATSPTEEACRRSVYVHIKRSRVAFAARQHDQRGHPKQLPGRSHTVPTQAWGCSTSAFTTRRRRLSRNAAEGCTGRLRGTGATAGRAD